MHAVNMIRYIVLFLVYSSMEALGVSAISDEAKYMIQFYHRTGDLPDIDLREASLMNEWGMYQSLPAQTLEMTEMRKLFGEIYEEYVKGNGYETKCEEVELSRWYRGNQTIGVYNFGGSSHHLLVSYYCKTKNGSRVYEHMKITRDLGVIEFATNLESFGILVNNYTEIKHPTDYNYETRLDYLTIDTVKHNIARLKDPAQKELCPNPGLIHSLSPIKFKMENGFLYIKMNINCNDTHTAVIEIAYPYATKEDLNYDEALYSLLATMEIQEDIHPRMYKRGDA